MEYNTEYDDFDNYTDYDQYDDDMEQYEIQSLREDAWLDLQQELATEYKQDALDAISKLKLMSKEYSVAKLYLEDIREMLDS